MTNIIVFLKGGVKDNVTILLLSLSMSDFTFLSLLTPRICTLIITHHAPDWNWPFSSSLLYVLLYWPAYTFYDFSSHASVWLGVTRCACIAMPLQFKSVFTKARTIKAVQALFALAVSLRVPVMSMFRVKWRKETHTNSSFPYVARSYSQSTVRFNDIVNRISIPWIEFIIMIACVTIIRLKLHQAFLVRQSHTSTSAAYFKRTNTSCNEQGRSAKDLRVIQSVVLICCIFILSQLPFLVYSTVRLVNPEIAVFRRLENLLYILTNISGTCSYLNASVNIFVYYDYNRRYRAIFRSMFKFKLANVGSDR
ncbi:chemosensory receptor c [Plakobranchus ocellatus]|uniref:Chemosensory receptor c n=1 Tax=Plakobranchus ocellatus TaxID=259542 RepID=A0AAV3YMM8_9GAST|nr:chemosensory receptor c [Plakobranchus ocellatus]